MMKTLEKETKRRGTNKAQGKRGRSGLLVHTDLVFSF